MATRRKLTRIRLDKIAAVDKPCQEHATVALVKRASDLAAPPSIIKRTFTEALNAQLVSEKISDTFWRAFEHQWAVRDAFRTALTDELADGGDGTEATSGFVAAMEQIATAAAQAARNAASTEETNLQAAVEEAVSKWLQHQEQPMEILNKAQLLTAVADFTIAKSTVAEAETIIEAAEKLGELAALDANPDLAKMAAKTKGIKKDDPEMAKVKRELAVLKLAPAARQHFDALAADQQDAFLAKSAEDQAAEIEAANAADPVVHKCADGTLIRKSDGAALLAMAKRNDVLSREIGELRQINEAMSLEKRANDQFPNVAKATVLDMLKAAAALGEESDAGRAILKSLTAMNADASRVFKRIGSTEASSVPETIEKARQDFDGEVARVAAREKIARADAMSKVRRERPDLFAAAYPETAEQDASARR